MPQSPDLSVAELVLDGRLSELGRLAEAVAHFCREHGLDGEAAGDLNLALEELFVNAVTHGGCEGKQESVRIRLEFSGDSVRAEFLDCGRPFDPDDAAPPDPHATLAERAAGGLGVHLARQAMGGLSYVRSGGWNRITMRRRV